MPISLSHREVRDLAKNLRDLTGREIKHTQILEAIAKAVGRTADAMMHELKNENAGAAAGLDSVEKLDADHMIMRFGFSQSANGRRGCWTMRVLERRDPDPATLDVVIEPLSDLRWLPHIDPTQPMWIVKAVHTSSAWSADRVERTVGRSGTEGLNLQSAIHVAFSFVATRHHLWSNADSTVAEYELNELNPLAWAELTKRETVGSSGWETPYNRARTLGFDVLRDDDDRPFLLDPGPIGSKAPRYRLLIDNDHPDGLSAPTDEKIWFLSMVFRDADGNVWRDPLQLFHSLTLEETCSKTEHFRNHPEAYAHVMAEVSASHKNRKVRVMTPEDSKRIAQQAGFEIWDTGGGCDAFAKLLREEKTPDGDSVVMELMITVEGGCSIDAAPDERVWGAGVNFTDPRGGHSPANTETDDLTLEEAIAVAIEYEKKADIYWAENYDAEAIAEYEASRHQF
jgi:hypothetical protein